MRCIYTSFLAASATLLLAVSAVETLPEMRHDDLERCTPSWPGPIAPVTELDVGAYTGRWFQVRGRIHFLVLGKGT